MGKINRFEDLEVWQLARELVKTVYKITSSNELSRDYGLSNQMQRSSVSVMANIAEGFERKSKKEFIQYLHVAKGSCGELRSHLYVALDLHYITKDFFNNAYALAETVSKSLSGFIKYLRGLVE